MLDYFTATLPHFLAYFGSAVALAAGFLVLYSLCTPHKEFALIRAGNSAAAVQLTGTFLGFAVPVAMVIGHSVNIPDMLLWGVVAGVVAVPVMPTGADSRMRRCPKRAGQERIDLHRNPRLP